MEKICGLCRRSKPLSEFGKNKALSDGLSNRCKPCKRGYMSEWKIVQRQKAKERPTVVRNYKLELKPYQSQVIDIVADNGKPASYLQIINKGLASLKVEINGYPASSFDLNPNEAQIFSSGDLLTYEVKVINPDAYQTALPEILVTVVK